MNDTDLREERSKAFTKRTVVWGIAAYIAIALSMSESVSKDPVGWLMFLVLPSFIAGLFVAVLLSDGAFISVSDCQAYNLNQVRIFLKENDDFQMDNVGGYALSTRAHFASMSIEEVLMNSDPPKFNS